jgi:hypothetical protein
MHHVMRLALVVASFPGFLVGARAQTQSEYKQADTNYYLRSDLFAADPAALIVTPEAVTNMGGTYLISTRGQAPQFVYLQQSHDWIEPITPPSEPASLNIPPTAMQVREPLGSVQVALPTAPADFHDVERGMTVPDGAVLRTGDNASVAVLFGGVDSVRLAPNTQAAVQMKIADGRRDVEVDVRSGMVFSKVGQRKGEKEAYAVHTPFGNATAHGTDYVTVVYPQRVDVWVAQGTVTLDAPDAPRQVTASNGHEPLKVMRNPAAKDAGAALAESAESLTALLNFIPMANQKLKALAARTQSGAHLTPTEKDYVGRIRQVVALIKLADINAPIVMAAAAPAPPKPVVVTAPPVSHVPPRALPVELTSAPVAQAAAPAHHTPAAAPARAASYKTRTVVIVLPPAHFRKTSSDEDETTDAPKTAEASKLRHSAPAVATHTAGSKPEEHYLRAKPVDPAELVGAPAVSSTPPPAAPPRPAHESAAVDPNSLGAMLNPLRPGTSALEPRPSTAASDEPAPTSSESKPAAGYTVP